MCIYLSVQINMTVSYSRIDRMTPTLFRHTVCTAGVVQLLYNNIIIIIIVIIMLFVQSILVHNVVF